VIRRFANFLAVAILCLPVCAQAPADWIAASNKYTNLLLTVEMKHTPELGSNQGLSQFDTDVSQPTLADEDQERQETEAVLATLKGAVGQQKQKEVTGPRDRNPQNRIAIPGTGFRTRPQSGLSECQRKGIQRAASAAR
jgi:hypothetical protein